MASESKNDIAGLAEKGGLLVAAIALAGLLFGLAHANESPQGVVEIIDGPSGEIIPSVPHSLHL